MVALPLHTRRYHARQYDQAHLLAVALARHLGRHAPARWLTRTRETRRQVGLNEAERADNLAGAFTAARQVAGQEVLLVDDVFTTGATARAAGVALLDAGASRVEVLTLARAFTHV
ncbi:competence protein F [Myxococcus sp. K15C18031901]|uniref:ComF family protein n=1 Tax=Myxococcus dinghuensis TaxID=2906761 RepID=UPI0020A7AE2A|nr:phosphoribosyltransferase family protein [Myxococcus dinghuensis]MCP3104635.1 competence protein F [Myxococcus dinghuensis]